MDLFEIASRKQFRFASPKGQLTVEDLWEVPLTSTRGTSLDVIAKVLHRELKEDTEISFVTPVTAADTTTRQKLDLVKHIIAIKIQERDAAKAAAATRARKQRIMEIIADKEDSALASKDLSELKAMLNAM